jgi:hypothetical protein
MCDLMPRTAGLPGIADTNVTGFLRRMQRESSRVYWTALVLGALVYALTPLLTVGVPLPVFALSPRLRMVHAERAPRLGIYLLRQAIMLVRLNAGMCWGADPWVRSRFALAAYPEDPGSYRA